MNKFRIVLTVFFIALVTGCATAPRVEPPAEEPELIVEEEPPVVVRKPMVALTFDDGPSDYTNIILDVLELHGGRVTFFVVGSRVERWRNIVIRAAEGGHEIVGHAWTHVELPSLNNRALAESLRATSEVIERVTGNSCGFIFRAPYGLVNQRVINVAKEMGYSIVNWSLDTWDWRLRDANQVHNAVMRGVRENSIILLHDIFHSTAVAMRRTIPALIAAGYELVTVSELLYHLHGELQPGVIY
jgi:peptidoglycan/xylan/chitin deacetylase (PgdA/CDA1 family)